MNKSIRDCLLNIIPKEHSWKIALLENWANIVGDFKKSITIEQIKEDILFLGVEHPALAHETLFLAPILKQKVNAYFEHEYIKTIRIKLKRTSNRNFEKQQIKHVALRNFATSMTTKEINLLNKLTDEDLRKAMQDFYLKCKSNRSLGNPLETLRQAQGER